MNDFLDKVDEIRICTLNNSLENLKNFADKNNSDERKKLIRKLCNGLTDKFGQKWEEDLNLKLDDQYWKRFLQRRIQQRFALDNIEAIPVAEPEVPEIRIEFEGAELGESEEKKEE